MTDAIAPVGPTLPICVVLTAARKAVGQFAPALAAQDFAADVDTARRWFETVAGTYKRDDGLLASFRDEPPHGMYLWLNDFPINPDGWFIAAFSVGPARPPRDDFDWRDALIGDDWDDLGMPGLTLTGMAAAREWFAVNWYSDEQDRGDAMIDLVRSAAFELVERVIRDVGPLSMRVTMSFSEDDTVAEWPAGARTGIVHLPPSRH